MKETLKKSAVSSFSVANILFILLQGALTINSLVNYIFGFFRHDVRFWTAVRRRGAEPPALIVGTVADPSYDYVAAFLFWSI